MFSSEYEFLKFGSILDFELGRGVPDELWRSQEDLSEAGALFEGAAAE
jgi:hypothetical protein